MSYRATKEHRQRHPDRARARYAVRYATRAGNLERRPCEECGDPRSEAHHFRGYSAEHRLAVRWLCKRHHWAEHRRPTEHGTLSTYKAGCRCAPCRAANTAYFREYRARRAAA